MGSNEISPTVTLNRFLVTHLTWSAYNRSDIVKFTHLLSDNFDHIFN